MNFNIKDINDLLFYNNDVYIKYRYNVVELLNWYKKETTKIQKVIIDDLLDFYEL